MEVVRGNGAEWVRWGKWNAAVENEGGGAGEM